MKLLIIFSNTFLIFSPVLAETSKYSMFKSLIICLIFVSFFLGYFLRENAVGGGKEFYLISWPIIQSFREDFLFTIQNYTTLLVGATDYQLPFSHMINAYLNPFSDNIVHFQLSTTIVSFTIFFIFAFTLKKAFLNINIFTMIFFYHNNSFIDNSKIP